MTILKISILAMMLALSACQPQMPTGTLLVKASGSGSFEIYRMAGETPLQFVSEDIGYYNQPIQLQTGSYLVLADCSHEVLVINPNEEKILISHQVEFIPPHEKRSGDKFSIQCNRFTKTKSIQHLQNRYTLNVLDGNRDLLVGMVPMNIDFKNMGDPLQPKKLSYQLSGIMLSDNPEIKTKSLFFVSPANNLISITENQDFGNWLYLLPGEYMVEVNGTALKVILAEKESRTIAPAFIRVSTDDQINLEISSNILGTPLYVELNDQHWLDLNETYPVLPGVALLKLNGSFRALEVTLTENELQNKEVRSVQVDLDCSPWDWDCLGRRKIYLYTEDQPYPFSEGISDVPILFFEQNVSVGVEGSRDIKYHLAEKKSHFQLKAANVTLIPIHTYRPGQITDLARIETIGAPLKGVTLDLPLEHEIEVPLIEGKYYLSHYTSSFSQEYERRSAKRVITIKQQTNPEIEYQVYISEKKFKKLQKTAAAKIKKTLKKESETKGKSRNPIIPIEVY